MIAARRLSSWLALPVLVLVTLGLLIAALVTALERSDEEAALKRETPPPAPVLRGRSIHDFGVVDLGEEGRRVEHVFELENTADVPVRIDTVATTCGCTDAGADREVVAPGATVRVHGAMTLSDTGHELAHVILHTDHPRAPRVRLSLSASARHVRQLVCARSHLVVTATRPVGLLVYATDHERDGAPAVPALMAPAGFTAAFGRWQLVEPRRPVHGQPARWEATITVAAADPSAIPDRIGQLVIDVEGMQSRTVTVQVESSRGG